MQCVSLDILRCNLYISTMNKTLLFLIPFLFLTVLISGCNSEKQTIRLGIESFDITPDGKSIIYTFRKSARMMVYKANIDGTQSRLLVGEGIDMQYYNPSCSVDGKQIAFIGSRGGNMNRAVFTSKIDGSNLRKLTTDSAIVMEAIFSLNSDTVYFTQAGEYGNYSPVASKAPHKFDIYRISLKDNSISKRTNEAAYSMYSLCDVDSNRWLLSLNMEGCYFYKKNGSGKDQIVTKNDNTDRGKSYSSPVIIDNDNIAAISYYRLVVINHKLNTEKLLLSLKGQQFGTIRYNKRLNKVFYTSSNDITSIHSISLDGTEREDITIETQL